MEKVTKRLRDAEGRPIGTAADNPLLDTSRAYTVEFPDGREESLTANLIAQNVYSQLDKEGTRICYWMTLFTTSEMRMRLIRATHLQQ